MSAIELAQQDLPFQFQLARLFGEPKILNRGGRTLRGYSWRGSFFVTEVMSEFNPGSSNEDLDSLE